MAVTIFIDIYLLYIFFTGRRAATERSQTLWAPLTPGHRSRPLGRNPSDLTERDPFGPLGRLLGYVVVIAAIAMLAYTVSGIIRPPG